MIIPQDQAKDLTPVRTVVEVHGKEVYQRVYFSETDHTPYYLVGSCTSEEGARAVARLLSL